MKPLNNPIIKGVSIFFDITLFKGQRIARDGKNDNILFKKAKLGKKDNPKTIINKDARVKTTAWKSGLIAKNDPIPPNTAPMKVYEITRPKLYFKWGIKRSNRFARKSCPPKEYPATIPPHITTQWNPAKSPIKKIRPYPIEGLLRWENIWKIEFINYLNIICHDPANVGGRIPLISDIHEILHSALLHSE